MDGCLAKLSFRTLLYAEAVHLPVYVRNKVYQCISAANLYYLVQCAIYKDIVITRSYLCYFQRKYTAVNRVSK